MRRIALDESLFHGGVSYERIDGGIKPWRLPYPEITLFPEELVPLASMTAGVRIGFVSSTRSVHVSFLPSREERPVDCVIDDELFTTGVVPANGTDLHITGLPPGEKRIELYLLQVSRFVVTRLAIDEDAAYAPLPGDRPRWITYGSSITHARAAASPSRTWPAIVARRRKLHLTCLGYGGQCHLEPIVARMIRDLPADFISLCLGINVYSRTSLSIRTFRSAAIGMIQTIRDKQPDVPIAVISPIFCRSRETEPNAVGLHLVTMRAELQEAVARLNAIGDTNLYYVDGLRILGPEHEHHLPDGVHPDAEGQWVMADNFERYVLSIFDSGRRDRTVSSSGDRRCGCS